MNLIDYSELFSRFDTMIRSGQGFQVRKQLLLLSSKRIPRIYLERYANLARRLGLSELSLRVLHPLVRSLDGRVEKPLPGELIEYAAALGEIGAVKESQKILLDRSLQEKDTRVFLYLSMSLFRNWQYEDAIPHLVKFVQLASDPYAKLVGNVNLAAAYCSTRKIDAAKHLIDNLLIQTKEQNFLLLHGNLLELRGQSEIYGGDLKLASEYLSRSQKILSESGNQSSIYPRKWNLYLIARNEQNLHAAFKVMLPLMNEARQQRQWETLRDIDRLLGVHYQDSFLAQKLYVGTPFDHYRKGLRNDFKNFVQPELFYLSNRWRTEPRGAIFDASTGKLDDKNIGIKPGALLHRLLATLVSDFYRPFSVGTIFSEVFPEEFYNPFSAHDRVFQAIKRLRAILNKEGLPIKVMQSKYEYSIKVLGNISIMVRSDGAPQEVSNLRSVYLSEQIRSLGPGKEFSISDIMNHLNTSLRTANRIAKEHVEKGQLTRIGKGKNTRYKLAG